MSVLLQPIMEQARFVDEDMQRAIGEVDIWSKERFRYVYEQLSSLPVTVRVYDVNRQRITNVSTHIGVQPSVKTQVTQTQEEDRGLSKILSQSALGGCSEQLPARTNNQITIRSV